MTDLFTYVTARKSDPATSQAAGERCAKQRSKDRLAVLAVHRQHRAGLTDFELADVMGRQQTSVGKRRGELRDVGLIVDSGERRPSPSGSPSIVWKLAKGV